MRVFARLLERYHQFTLRMSIFNRVLIGNSIIIIFGAVAGTIITRQMTLFGNIWLILLFSFPGILITLLVNRMIIHTALYPLHELGDAIERVHSGQINIPDSLKSYKDPDISRLVIAIDSMLNRMANYTSQLQAISERAINAQEEERVRIARSLHDDTAQSISMLIIDLDRLGNFLPPDRPDITRSVADAQNVATRHKSRPPPAINPNSATPRKSVIRAQRKPKAVVTAAVTIAGPAVCEVSSRAGRSARPECRNCR